MAAPKWNGESDIDLKFLKFDEMNKRMKRESPSSEAGMMGNINENGKSEQNNNGENIDQSGNGLDIKCGVCSTSVWFKFGMYLFMNMQLPR
jgi:hypothetical protein